LETRDSVQRRHPTNDRWSSFPARAPLALLSARSGLAGGPTAAGYAQELPAIAGADPRIGVTRDVGSAVTLDNIETAVGFVCVEGAAGDWYEAVEAVAASACE
jgi:hypothetical protein